MNHILRSNCQKRNTRVVKFLTLDNRKRNVSKTCLQITLKTNKQTKTYDTQKKETEGSFQKKWTSKVVKLVHARKKKKKNR